MGRLCDLGFYTSCNWVVPRWDSDIMRPTEFSRNTFGICSIREGGSSFLLTLTLWRKVTLCSRLISEQLLDAIYGLNSLLAGLSNNSMLCNICAIFHWTLESPKRHSSKIAFLFLNFGRKHAGTFWHSSCTCQKAQVLVILIHSTTNYIVLGDCKMLLCLTLYFSLKNCYSHISLHFSIISF